MEFELINNRLSDNISSDNISSFTTNENRISIYRFKFTDEFTKELYEFSKIHQYDDRQIFKEAWTIWVNDNTEIINEEIDRLSKLGYDGDIIDKMFKSARYYFRKKSTEKKEPAKRRVYINVPKELLASMDRHILTHLNDADYKPKDGFDDFCKKNTDILKEEVNNLCKNGFTDSNQIKNKIKKTYKNRYFLLISK